MKLIFWTTDINYILFVIYFNTWPLTLMFHSRFHHQTSVSLSLLLFRILLDMCKTFLRLRTVDKRSTQLTRALPPEKILFWEFHEILTIIGAYILYFVENKFPNFWSYIRILSKSCDVASINRKKSFKKVTVNLIACEFWYFLALGDEDCKI